jgi:acetylornithine/N-succinyldiaminopimelate aminotransferase
VGDVIAAGYDAHVIAIPAAENVARLLPALTISDAEIAEAVERLDTAASRLATQAA